MVDIVPLFPAKVQKLWNSVEPRLLVVVSLLLQIVLVATGTRRKYTRNKFLTLILWLSYLSADYVATLALGVLSKAGEGDAKHLVDPSYIIMAFWAPFLLMHLGGPDTITAYALADNELWTRHALSLAGQVLVAVYVFFRSWISTAINYLWILVFFGGLVKYLERTWVLYLASRDRFRESMVTDPDPGPNYAKFMDELVSREDEGYEVYLAKAVETPPPSSQNDPAERAAHAAEGTDQDQDQDDDLQAAYYFFGTFRKLFADLILSFQDKENSLAFFNGEDVNWDKAFNIVEIELGLVYDLFYTKAFILYSRRGIILRFLSIASTVAASVPFLMIGKNGFPKTEVIITYILLTGAIFLEFYALLMLLSSDWVMIRLTGDWTRIHASRQFKDLVVLSVRRVVSWLRRFYIVPSRMRWSNAIGQYNILNCCIKGKPARMRWLINAYKILSCCVAGKRKCVKDPSVPNGLKALIFDELKKRVVDDDDNQDKKKGSYRGEKIWLKKLMDCYDKEHKQNHDVKFDQIHRHKKYDELEFDQSLLLWHMATDICYYTDVDKKHKPNERLLSEFIIKEDSSPKDTLEFKREICRLLSNYMMHLLIRSPFMLPSGIGQIRFQDTCAEATEFFSKNKLDKGDACEKLRDVDTRLAPSKVKGDRSKSLLFDACRLAKSLELSEFRDRKWDIMTQAWLDILTFAAAQCQWNYHAEKLSQGGELLTHVWLLMAHFGMTDQFQISQGYMRAKLQLA